MESIRVVGHAPQMALVAEQLCQIGPCIGCDGCRGVCAALLEALSLPDAVLNKGAQ